MTFDVMDVNEGNNVTFVCRVSSDVPYIFWNVNFGSHTAPLGVTNSGCTTQPPGTTFLDNTSEYIYTCNNTVYQVTKLNVQRSEHNDIHMCTSAPPSEAEISNWIIKVKAPVKSVTMTPANNTVDVTENTAVEFHCTTSTSRPAASVYWFIHPNGNSSNITQITENITTMTDYNEFSVITSTLRFVPSRHHNNMKIFCSANNSVNTSPVMSIKKLLNVLYKADDPYIIQGSEYRVIENTQGTLSCSVKGGNPTPTLSWSCNKFSPTNQSVIKSNGNTTTTFPWIALRNHNGTCTCTSQQTKFQTEAVNVSLVVLYPPSKPVLEVNGGNVVGDISFMEGTTRSIECTSDSKPPPDIYSWTGPTIHDSVNTQYLTFNTIEKSDAGQYKCSVHNTMNPSGVVNVTGVNTSDVNVVVLYGPVVTPINNVSILQGKELNISCPYTAGIPSKTSINWTRNNDDELWDGEQLLLSSIKKGDAGNYSCDASNVMRPSGDNISYVGKSSQSFYLDVLYAASVTSFIVEGFPNQTVTVNESETVPFICIADSNPTAVTTLSDESKIIQNVPSNNLKYNITRANCSDAGIFVCTAKNEYIGEENVQKEVQLFVNCYPRATGVIDTNITSEKNNTITIVFNVIAYPPPTFTWWQFLNETWTDLNNDDNFDIQSSNHQSNLTIRKVGVEDFTSYKVIVENDIGKMEQPYALSQYDKPDPPTGFRHIESQTTTTSIHLEWKPGFDNGPSQTFFIKYKRSSDTLWNYINVPDNGEQTMVHTLTGLTEDTQYEIVILSSNVKGNSSESSVLVTTAKAIVKQTSSPAPLIGGITGGVTGCIIIVIVIIVLIRRYSLLKGNRTDKQDIRRSVSEDSDEEDGLVDNPMYESSTNVASAASTSTDVYAKPIKPKKPNVTGTGDVYAVVDKTKKQGKVEKGQPLSRQDIKQDVNVYETFELENDPNKKGVAKQFHPEKSPPKESKPKIVNKDGLIYADLVFNDKQPGKKMVIIGDDPTPYDRVDFKKKAEPLPESDNEDDK
ncbi:carbohydrate binding [Mactra antiquata]